MRRAAAFFAALLLTPAFGLAAQAPLYSNVGNRVRLKTDSASQWLVGTLVGADGDSLRLRVADRAPIVSVARRTVSQFEVRYGGHSKAGKGALTGFFVGAAAGAIAGFASGDDPPGWFSFTAGQKALVLGLLGSASGALLGAVIGASSHSDRWTSVSLGRAKVALAPRGAGLALSVTF
jgi:hypothetical protein